MVDRYIRIGSAEELIGYDDVDYPSAIETDQPIRSGAPVDPNDVVRLADLSTRIEGPAASIDSDLAEFDGITGKQLKDGGLSHANAADAISKKHTQGTDTALGALGTKNPPIDADKAVYRDSAAADALVTSTWAQIKAFLKTYFDTIYGAYSTNSWTPALKFGGAAVDITYSTQSGTYVRIGDLVFARIYLILTSKGSSVGNASITDLPFTIGLSTVAPMYLYAVKFANQHQAYGGSGTTEIYLQEITEAGTVSNLTDADFANNSRVMISIVYKV